MTPVRIQAGNERVGWVFKDTMGLTLVNTTIVIPPQPSAWNPLDIVAATPLPPCLVLTEDNRLATRDTVLPDQWEAGVRGEQSRGGVPGERWYLELEVVSIGDGAIPNDNQGMQFGLIDATTGNVLSRPPTSPASEVTNTSGSNYVLVYTRLDGCIFASEPSPPTQTGDVGSQPAPGDVFGFDWLVGTSVTVLRNNVVQEVVPLTFAGMLFPYFSAGQTLVDAVNQESTESCRIATGRRQQTYTRSGATSWG